MLTVGNYINGDVGGKPLYAPSHKERASDVEILSTMEFLEPIEWKYYLALLDTMGDDVRYKVEAEILSMSVSKENFMENTDIVKDLKEYLNSGKKKSDKRDYSDELNYSFISDFKTIKMKLNPTEKRTYHFFSAGGYYYRILYCNDTFKSFERIKENMASLCDWDKFDYTPDGRGDEKVWQYIQ